MADTNTEDTASLERPADAGKPPRGIVVRWCKEIDLAGRVEEPWRKNAREVLKRYRDEAQLEKGAVKSRKLGTRFNILRPNTRVMKAAIYQEPPKPDVRRRFKDKDPLGKAVSEVTERALSFCMDKYDLDGALVLAVNDMLLPGRGVTRVRYEPEFMPQPEDKSAPQGAVGPQQEQAEQIAWEKVCPKHVNWEDFRRGPGRIWDEVPWVAYRHRLTRDEAIKEIPEAKALLETIDLDCTLDMTDEDERAVKDNPSLKDVFKRLTLWEIWDKTKREVLFIAPSYKQKPIHVRPDPLGLEGFFDIPRPLYAVEESDTLVPLEDFRAYADQAKELDNITKRIDTIVAAIKVRGLYDATLKAFSDLMGAEEASLIPAEEVAALYNNGGIEKSIWMWPVDKIAQVLQYLYEHREQTKQIIYEITGLSDIMRGSTKASETATAQSIKAQNGAISIQDRRKAVKRYARDIVRIAAELICEQFQIETLRQMTGLDYPTEQEKQQLGMQLQMLQQQAMQAQQMAAAQPPVEGQPAPAGPPQQPQGQPQGPDPEQLKQLQDRLDMPSWEQIQQVMRDDRLRSYRIDVETDETAFGDQAAEQQAVTELLTSVTGFLTAMAPLVQGGVVPPEVAKSMLMMAVRRFRAGREVEDSLDELGENPLPPPPDPNAGKVEVEKEKLGFEREKHQQQMGFEREKHDAQMAREAEKNAFERESAEFDRAFQGRQHDDEMQQRGDELAFTKQQYQDGIDKETGAEAMKAFGSEFPAQLQQTMQMLAEIGQAVVQSNQATQQLVAQQGERDAAMMQALTQAIVTGMNQPKKVKRGKDGKITEVVPVQ